MRLRLRVWAKPATGVEMRMAGDVLSAAREAQGRETFFLDLADAATPLARLTRTKVSSLSMSACCFSYTLSCSRSSSATW